MHRCLLQLLCVSAALAVAAASPTADAARLTKTHGGTGSANCQGALPSYEGAIRKRPLAVQNEGSTDAFVTCAFSITAGAVTEARLVVSTLGGVDVTVRCTGVNGQVGNEPIYANRSVVAPASGATTALVFTGASFGGTAGPFFPRGPLVSMSCALPPGAAINTTLVTLEDEVGA